MSHEIRLEYLSEIVNLHDATKLGWTEVPGARERLVAKEEAARRELRIDIQARLRGKRGP